MDFLRLKLKITRADESIYWVEYFNDIDSLNSWLDSEITRPYWDNEWTTETVVLDDQNAETPYEP